MNPPTDKVGKKVKTLSFFPANKSPGSLNTSEFTTLIWKKSKIPPLPLAGAAAPRARLISILTADGEQAFVLWKTPAARFFPPPFFRQAKHFDQPRFYFPPSSPPPLLSWLPPRRAAHSLAERGAGRHLLGEDERDLAPPTRLLAAGRNRDVSLTVFARATTPPCLFSYQPAEAQPHKSTRQPGLHGWWGAHAGSWWSGSSRSGRPVYYTH